ncbi:restriction endonuclease subunit S [Bacillus sp. ChL18]|uniref:restriction endonuclease subunit S n=1 Tax=Bacillus TaxID=1386 RepID=UPI0022488C88|nr:restriction endonuclease subunit S [Bacillus sp. ChL18]MCX2812004.1 restriction endonuclease subunit S [Bacillus sp. ChL18]
MVMIKDIFHIVYGNISDTKRDLKEGEIPLIAAGSKNNGVLGYYDIEKRFKNIITVPRTGANRCEGFYHPYECNVADSVLVLVPKEELNQRLAFYYILLIKKEKYRYNFGRKVTPERLGNTVIPNKIPDWVYNTSIPDFDKIKLPVIKERTINLNPANWKEFIYTDLFEIKKGKRVTKMDLKPGDTPFITAIDSNNGLREYCDLPPLYPENVITVPYNGNGVGEAFYQPKPFWASDDINVLIPKFELNKFTAMFIITVIRKEKYRFNYGRKWHKERMEESTIKLPVKSNGKPDWDYMEDFIKALPYTNGL